MMQSAKDRNCLDVADQNVTRGSPCPIAGRRDEHKDECKVVIRNALSRTDAVSMAEEAQSDQKGHEPIRKKNEKLG